MKIKKWKKLIFAAALLAVLAISGISALFTDGDTMANIFTVGKVDIKLLEPSWTPSYVDVDGVKKMPNITPRQEFAKDPQIANVGANDAYVFMEVVVPYANLTTVDDAGGTKKTAETPLFSYDVKDGWVQIGDTEKNTVLKTITRRYAYGTADTMSVLPKNGTTNALFDYIRFANVVEDQAQGELEKLEELEKIVLINAYAIQTDNINDGKILPDGNNADGKVKPADVWEVLFNQRLVDYTPLEYIESTGSQYIDTGIMPSSDMTFEIDYQVTSGKGKLYGSETLDGDIFDAYDVGQTSANIRAFKHHTAYGTVTNITTVANEKVALKVVVKDGTYSVYVNGENKNSAAVKGLPPDDTMYLFASHRLGNADGKIKAKIWGCKIYKSGALVGDFRPCITPDGDVGMYNTVDKTYHLNKGTGNFVTLHNLPDECVQLAYIQSSGTQYFNSGYKHNENTILDIKITPLSSSQKYNCIFGSRTKYDKANWYGLYFYGDDGTIHVNHVEDATTPDKVTFDQTYTFVLKSGQITVNGTNYSSGSIPSASLIDYILANNQDNKAVEHTHGNLYYFNIQEGDKPIRNYVPCKLISDIPDSKCADASLPHTKGTLGLWDRVEDKFYANAGTGTFIAGPEI